MINVISDNNESDLLASTQSDKLLDSGCIISLTKAEETSTHEKESDSSEDTSGDTSEDT